MNQLKETPSIEIFRLEEMGDDTIFDNYQRYDFYQLLWFTQVEGDPTYFLDFDEYTLQENQIVLIFPGQIDKLDVAGKRGFLFAIHSDILFHINQRLNSDYLNGYFSNSFISLDPAAKRILSELNALMLEEYHAENRLPLMESYLAALLFHVSSLFEKSVGLKANTDSFVAELMRLIDFNFVQERETDFYANRLNTSNKRVNELCKKGTGRTVKQHLQERLILEIKKEIRMGKKSLKEIAFDLGFNEAAYFTRFFKQHTSMTPTQFRDM